MAARADALAADFLWPKLQPSGMVEAFPPKRMRRNRTKEVNQIQTGE
jgi:hypothetical protein